MTKLEAEAYESMADSKFSKALGEDCKCSLSLVGRFKISFDNNYITFFRDWEIAWVKYEGSYTDLIVCVEKALQCINDNKELINRLIWSYEHRSELT